MPKDISHLPFFNKCTVQAGEVCVWGVGVLAVISSSFFRSFSSGLLHTRLVFVRSLIE